MGISNFIKTNVLFFLIILCSINLTAQNKNTEKVKEKRFNIVKINLLSLIDYTPSIQCSYQYNIFKRFHIQHEAGYITHYLSPFWDNDSEMNGYRIKNQIKYYLTSPEKKRNTFYVAAEFMFKKTSFFDEKEFGMNDFAYFQMIKYKKTKEIYAFSLIFGFEPEINNKKLILDLYSGLGYRHLSISHDLPPDLSISGRNIFRRDSGVYNLPGLYFGLRLGYKFDAIF